MLLNSLGADLKQGDLTRPGSLKRIISGVDTVIHLGALELESLHGFNLYAQQRFLAADTICSRIYTACL
jgi:hypothetical protein